MFIRSSNPSTARGARFFVVAAVGLSIALGASRPCLAQDSTDDFSRQLMKQAPQIVDYLKGRGYRNVGVLKFRIKKGREPLSDNVGTLNMFAAHRLEVALALANNNRPGKPDEQIGIIRHASAVAAKISGATHATKSGREKLFEARYPLAWGAEPDARVKADAFLTGIVLVSEDLQQMTVGILAFDREGNQLEKAVELFTAKVGPSILDELGESFVVRGAFDGGSPQLAKAQAVQQAKKVKAKETSFPLEAQDSPVDLQVLYDGQPVALDLERRQGEALIAEPQEGQQVAFVLRRREGAKGRLAVVLKVNGENTLYRQKLPARHCNKWILEPGAPPITVRGYQKSDQQAEAFRVLSTEESKSNEINYGDDVGTISLVVFREKPKGVPADLPLDDADDLEAEDLLALTRGVFPDKQPLNLAALKYQLRNSQTETRGLIAQGADTKNQIRHVTFEADEAPVMIATIRYYRP